MLSDGCCRCILIISPPAKDVTTIFRKNDRKDKTHTCVAVRGNLRAKRRSGSPCMFSTSAGGGSDSKISDRKSRKWKLFSKFLNSCRRTSKEHERRSFTAKSVRAATQFPEKMPSIQSRKTFNIYNM